MIGALASVVERLAGIASAVAWSTINAKTFCAPALLAFAAACAGVSPIAVMIQDINPVGPMMMFAAMASGPTLMPGFTKVKFLGGTPDAPGEKVIGTVTVAPTGLLMIAC